MSGVDPRRIEEVFDGALALESADRERYLDEACVDDRALRLEVEALLAHDTLPSQGEARAGRTPDAVMMQAAAIAIGFEPTLVQPEGPGASVEALRSDDALAAARGDDLPRGHTIDRFEVLAKIGEGGMGVVYEAYDRRLDRRVAVKLVRLGGSPTRARLLREAQAMAKVSHPNVVAIYEVGVIGEEVFVAMELVPGETLAAWLDREPRSWREALTLYVGAGRGLAAAHAAGIIHRDFKPDNVLVGKDGRPRVVDFGLARARGDAIETSSDGAAPAPIGGALGMELTAFGTLMGTPAYMSPEHFRGRAIDPKSDQWSFAVAVYRALFGAPPFEGESVAELSDHVLRGALRPPSRALGVPEKVVRAVVRALSRDPDQRFASMEELLAELEAPLASDPEAERARGRAKRRLAAILLAIAAAASLAVVGRAPGFDFSPHGLLMQGYLAVGTLAVCGVVFRRTIMESAYNRQVALLFAVPVVGFVVHRLLAIELGSRVEEILVGDALTLAALSTFAGFTVDRRLGFLAPFALLYAVAAVIVPAIAAPAFGTMLLVSTAVGAWIWGEPRAAVSNRK